MVCGCWGGLVIFIVECEKKDFITSVSTSRRTGKRRGVGDNYLGLESRARKMIDEKKYCT